MRFSARFLASAASLRAASASAASSPLRAAVPFIGRACSTPSWWRRKSSGEHDSTQSGPPSSASAGRRISAPKATGWRARRRR
jgi:hypothetical protein